MGPSAAEKIAQAVVWGHRVDLTAAVGSAPETAPVLDVQWAAPATTADAAQTRLPRRHHPRPIPRVWAARSEPDAQPLAQGSTRALSARCALSFRSGAAWPLP